MLISFLTVALAKKQIPKSWVLYERQFCTKPMQNDGKVDAFNKGKGSGFITKFPRAWRQQGRSKHFMFDVFDGGALSRSR